MNLLKKYIRKEIKDIFYERTMRVPQILKSFLKDNLKLNPTGHYIIDIKYPVSTDPTYEITLVNNETFNMIYKEGPNPTFIVNIGNKNYDLSIPDEQNLAQKALDNLLTGEKFSPGEEEGGEGEEDFGAEPEVGGGEEEAETEPEEET